MGDQVMKPRKPHRNRHDRAAIVEGYANGEKIRVLTARHDIDERTLKRLLHKSGVPMRPAGRPRNRGAADAEVR